jgi:hypothetical protein
VFLGHRGFGAQRYNTPNRSDGHQTIEPPTNPGLITRDGNPDLRWATALVALAPPAGARVDIDVAHALCPPGDSPHVVDKRAKAGECASTVAGIPTQ